MGMILGIDLGGTKSAALLADEHGAIQHRTARPTPADADAEGLFAFLAELVSEVSATANETIVGCGVSAGAPTFAAEGMVYAAPNLPGWGEEGFPLATRLSQHLGGVPVRVENDADATALAEHRFGAGQGTRTMAFLTIGTGIGAGLILDGHLHRGRIGAGGEIGHICVDEPVGRACPCGLRGCLEAYASGPSVMRIAVEQGYMGPKDGASLATAARNADPAAAFAFRQAAEKLGAALATLTMLVNPERIVLGTLAVHAGDLLLPGIRHGVSERTWKRLGDGVDIVPAALGDRAQDLAALCAWLGPGTP